MLVSTYYDSALYPRKETPILRILYEHHATRLFSSSSFFFLLRCARPVITKLAFNEGWRCCCCCCCEGSSYTRQSGEKCRMYARRALSFSSWALAAFPRFSTRRGARFACHRRKPFSSGPWRATGNENTRGAHRLSFIFNARYILAGSL